MGLCIVSVMAEVSLSGMLSTAGDWIVTALWVVAGLGFVIFVHELGHFLVAKACGVKCEKFYLGFDIGGWKLAKFTWGETEYGIGALPLGGYVKMLGQDDNPARAAEERQRALAAAAQAAESGLPDQAASALSAAGPAATQQADAAPADSILDPRSYTAKSVPQRMAIISAGVTMNLIFAVLMATVAYWLGVKEVACGMSGVLAGEPAWRADLEPGDRIVAIGQAPNPYKLRYSDLISAVMFSNLETGVDFEIDRDGVDKPFWRNIKPDKKANRLAPIIGVLPPCSLELIDIEDIPPVRRESVAAKTEKFRGGDWIVAINGAPINDYRAYLEALAQHPGDTLQVTVRHKPTDEERKLAREQKTEPLGQEETILVPPQPRVSLGLEMTMGPITAVQKNSPADNNGLLEAGDDLVQIDGESPGDPATLAERLRRRAGKTITLNIQRDRPGDRSGPIERTVTLREPKWFETPFLGGPLSAPALGVAFKEINRIKAIEPGSPAASATLEIDGKPATPEHFVPGDEIVKAEFLLPEDKKDIEEYKLLKKSIEFGVDKPNWPFFMAIVQEIPAGTKVRLTLADSRSAVLAPEQSKEWFNPDRGFYLGAERKEFRADSWGEAFELGARETKQATLMVVSFLRAVFSGRVSVKNISGPVGVAGQAADAAKEGLARFLLFLTMLSANLAVVNFLPIPVLDGGHMVFLTLEAIMRRPVSERVVVALSYLGLLFILSLMLFVLALDTGLISRFS